MFGLVLTTAISLMQIYVFWRAASVPLVKSRVPLWLLLGTGTLLWSAFVGGRFYAHQNSGTMAAMLELFGMTWMGVLFLLFVALLAVDLITAFGFFLPRLAPALRGAALIAGGVLVLIALGQGLRAPVVKDYQVRLAGLPAEMNNTVLVAMSDLHLGSLLGKGWLEARVAQVQALRPDLVVLLGDLFEGHHQPQSELLPILRRLLAPLGVWVVPGNHEFHGRQDNSSVLIQEAGFQLLRNRWAELEPGLILAGIDDLTASRRSGQAADYIGKALTGRPPGATILLSHTPWQADRAARAGVGLMLSGHTHGGQIWPFGYLVGIAYPLFAGQYEVAGMTVIVCRGTGTWGPRMRLWQPSEILRIKLTGK